MTAKVGDIVGAVVVAVAEGGATLSLPDGTTGHLYTSQMDPQSAADTPALTVGAEVLVKVTDVDRAGQLILSPARTSPEDKDVADFHDEVVQMRSALAERSVNLAQEQRPEDRVEWRLQEWLDQGRNTLSRLERHRAKRLTKRIQGD